jgi:hypothetical protein
MRLVIAPENAQRRVLKLLGSGRIVTSQIAYIECVCKPLELRRADLVDAFDDFFTSVDVDLIDVDARVARHASAVRATHRLKVPRRHSFGDRAGGKVQQFLDD